MLAAGCSCVPDSGAPWLVFAILVLGSVAVLLAGLRWQRRSASTAGAPARRGVRAALAAGLLAALAVTAALVRPDTDGSLLLLGAGVVAASAGVAPSSRRRRDAPVR